LGEIRVTKPKQSLEPDSHFSTSFEERARHSDILLPPSGEKIVADFQVLEQSFRGKLDYAVGRARDAPLILSWQKPTVTLEFRRDPCYKLGDVLFTSA
jgi:hypothetical protein